MKQQVGPVRYGSALPYLPTTDTSLLPVRYLLNGICPGTQIRSCQTKKQFLTFNQYYESKPTKEGGGGANYMQPYLKWK